MTAADTAAVIAAKFVAKAIKLTKRGLGSNLPGRVARRISPDIVSRLSRQAKLGVLAVSGTNGKSTTSGLLSSILRTAGLSHVHNKQGANLVPGITASLVISSEWNGKLDADYCLFEMDEAALPVLAREMPIQQVVVTNLFRDQLDRFGELDTTARLIESGIATNSSLAILNADDPNVSQLAKGSNRLFFGIESMKSDENQSETSEGAKSHTTELSYCSNCGCETTNSKTFYGQLGHWRCSSCDVARPTPSVAARNVAVGATSSKFTLELDGRHTEVTVPLPGLFNVYNALAAAASAHSLNVSPETIRQGLKNYKTLFGRSEKVKIGDATILIQLIKNPAGASQAVSAVVADENARVLIAINDNFQDGRDVSWLWDADFEKLGEHRKEMILSGLRAEDMVVRMKYAGVPSDLLTPVSKLEEALDKALKLVQPGETLWILPTYTCLLDLQKIFKAKGHPLSGT